VAAWLSINPMVFGKPAHERAWASRAMLGEEQWIVDRPRDVSTVLGVVSSTAAVVAIVAARRHRLRTAVAATAVQMALTLVYWALMVRYFDRRRR
jgi:hypothetical protein